MTYRATNEMVQRVLPLIEQLTDSRIEKARLVQYLAASFGVDLGVMTIVSERQAEDRRLITYRDAYSGEEHELTYPATLTPELEPLVLTEYKRLAVDKPLTKMDRQLFDRLFKADYCDRCRYRDDEYAQFHAECRFAGHPVNFEPE